MKKLLKFAIYFLSAAIFVAACKKRDLQVPVIAKHSPVANAGPDQTICATSTTLAGNTPTVGTGIWSLVSGSGTITTPSSPSSGVTGLGVGANTFRWTIDRKSVV